MRTTEQDSLHLNLEQKSVSDLVHGINSEDQKVAHAVGEQIPFITAFIEALVPRMEQGGRLFYICLLYTSPSPRDLSTSRMPSSA